MIPVLFTAAMVGVTEPMEFTVLFANPFLYYLVHVPLAALAAVICEATKVSVSGDALVFMLGISYSHRKCMQCHCYGLCHYSLFFIM